MSYAESIFNTTVAHYTWVTIRFSDSTPQFWTQYWHHKYGNCYTFNRGKDDHNRKTKVKTSSIPGHVGGKNRDFSDRCLSNWAIGIHVYSVHTKITNHVHKAQKYTTYSKFYVQENVFVKFGKIMSSYESIKQLKLATCMEYYGTHFKRSTIHQAKF